jgi:hypothetical protein
MIAMEIQLICSYTSGKEGIIVKSHTDLDANEKAAEAALISLIGLLQIDKPSRPAEPQAVDKAFTRILNFFRNDTYTDEYRQSSVGSERAALAMMVLIDAQNTDYGPRNPRSVTPHDLRNIQAAIKYTKNLIQKTLLDEVDPADNTIIKRMERVLFDLRIELVSNVLEGDLDKKIIRARLDIMFEYAKKSKYGFTDEDKAFFWECFKEGLQGRDKKDELLAEVVKHKVFKSSNGGMFSKPSGTFERMRAEMDEMMSAQKAVKKDKAAYASKKH